MLGFSPIDGIRGLACKNPQPNYLMICSKIRNQVGSALSFSWEVGLGSGSGGSGKGLLSWPRWLLPPRAANGAVSAPPIDMLPQITTASGGGADVAGNPVLAIQ